MDQSTRIDWHDATDPNKRTTREFSAESEEGRRRTGALWIPDGETCRSLIAFGHGASGDRYQAPIPYLAGKFIRVGFPALSIDGPVHGLRQVGEGGRIAFGEEMRRDRMIDDMVDDWQFAIELSKQVIEQKLLDMAYFGLSMGSIFGIPLIANEDRGLPVSAATLGLLGSQGLGKRLGERISADAAKVTCPTLFLMQLEDELFNREGYLDLFDAIASKDKRIHANPGLHPEVPGFEMRFAFEFLLNHLEN